MNLKQVGSNMTEVELQNGFTVLFSYSTPVAVYITCKNGTRGCYQTDKKWSVTTTRHINKWLRMHPEILVAPYMPQEYFDNLMKEVA